jgi:microfibrillar-associated protein 1
VTLLPALGTHPPTSSSEEKEDAVPDIDDTDGLDPEGEFEAWRLRELGRIKRDKEAELRREEEREEIERRRALPEAQRMKEDLEHAQTLRDQKPKGQQKFLQKYWHKGAFHQVRAELDNFPPASYLTLS